MAVPERRRLGRSLRCRPELLELLRLVHERSIANAAGDQSSASVYCDTPSPRKAEPCRGSRSGSEPGGELLLYVKPIGAYSGINASILVGKLKKSKSGPNYRRALDVRSHSPAATCTPKR